MQQRELSLGLTIFAGSAMYLQPGLFQDWEFLKCSVGLVLVVIAVVCVSLFCHF